MPRDGKEDEASWEPVSLAKKFKCTIVQCAFVHDGSEQRWRWVECHGDGGNGGGGSEEVEETVVRR